MMSEIRVPGFRYTGSCRSLSISGWGFEGFGVGPLVFDLNEGFLNLLHIPLQPSTQDQGPNDGLGKDSTHNPLLNTPMTVS